MATARTPSTGPTLRERIAADNAAAPSVPLVELDPGTRRLVEEAIRGLHALGGSEGLRRLIARAMARRRAVVRARRRDARVRRRSSSARALVRARSPDGGSDDDDPAAAVARAAHMAVCLVDAVAAHPDDEDLQRLVIAGQRHLLAVTEGAA